MGERQPVTARLHKTPARVNRAEDFERCPIVM